MSTTDDRQEFEAHKDRMSRALAQDGDALKRSVELLMSLNRYDYPYLWSWMGVPIIQLPADVMATQEAIWNTRPDVIIETGVARGGSLIFMASILAATGQTEAKVIGVDIDIRAHNRESIETHHLADRIELVQGGSTDESTLEQVRALIPPGAKVMVVLDSDHTFKHVLDECRAYGPLVSDGCYLVVADTVVGHIPEGSAIQRSKQWETGNDPLTALRQYLTETQDFEVDPAINGKLVFSSSPGGYCRRLKTSK